MAAERLVAALRERIVWIDGHADIWAAFADAEVFAEVVGALIEPYRDDGITHVAGVESRAFILGGAAAIEAGAGFVAVRKASGHLPGDVVTSADVRDYQGGPVRLRLQRQRVKAGSRVLIVDDWFETGGQFAAARALIETAGATVIGASVVVDETPPALHASLGKYRYIVRAAELQGAGCA